MPESVTVRGLPVEVARRLLETMILSRCLEDRLHSLYLQSRIHGRLISGRGQEAIAVGAAAALAPDEVICPVHRDLGAHLQRGTPPLAVLLHYFRRQAGPSRGRDGDIHMAEWSRRVFPMVSHLPDSWPIAVGIALASRLSGRPRTVLAFAGDGASSTGLWHESLNLAAVFKTPNVFVIENNQYAYSTPTTKQFAIERLADRGAAYGIPSSTVDGNDVVAVYVAVQQAAERAREGGGPTLIEAMTMRMDGHAVHDPADYVPKKLLDEWIQRDPIERLINELVPGHFRPNELDDLRSRIQREIDAAVVQAESAALPDPADLMDGVYA
ncbi:MAG TPA: thiamine pyrophosphate-dependent dehydrogenase E1 component subunit alpha [Isosphaeraceae bacterium]|nr:thiamine pyrophosphate-dependent dehydrogenase E1 component subunit alpha [Isosphaeraceae bacterium]